MTPVLSPIHGGHVSGTLRSYMKNLSDNWEELRLKVLGLGDSSVRKTHYPSLRKRLAELEQIRSKLQQSEAYLAEAQRLSHTGSFGWYVSSGEIVWSDETYRIFEYDRSVKPTIDSVVQRVHPQDRADFQKVIDGASRGATDFEHTYRLLLPDGRLKHVHAIARAVQDASGNREFVGAATDITERKRAEEDLRASERKYRHLVDTTPAFIHTALPDGSLDFLSRGWLEYGGIPQTDFLDWCWTAAIHPEDVEGFVDKWRAALASGEPFVGESRVRRADGEYRWFLQRNVPLRDETGKIVKWYGTGIDIEERKRAEESLRSSEAYLAEAQRLSHTGSWAWSPDTDLRHWSEECYRVMGFDPRDGLPRTEELIQRIHPDDQPAFRESTKRATHNRLDEEIDYRIVLEYVGLSLEEWRQTPGNLFSLPSFFHPDDRERAARTYSDNARSGGSAFELELRMRKRDGTYRWFLVRFNPLRDEEGQITRWYVASTDIEDRKQAEDKLRHENVALREEIDKASMFEEIVGTSPALKSVLSRISKVAPSDSTVLITGETGTGKELVARAIHRRSV